MVNNIPSKDFLKTLNPHTRAIVEGQLGTKAGGKQRKYKNKRVLLEDGWSYDSITEARYSLHLDHLRAGGWIQGYMRQVSIPVAPKLRYMADFMITWKKGNVEWVDVKGVETAVFKNKMKMLAHTAPWIEIKLVTAKWVQANCPQLPASAKPT